MPIIFKNTGLRFFLHSKMLGRHLKISVVPVLAFLIVVGTISSAFLWKNFDKTKKSFVVMCNLVDEIADADALLTVLTPEDLQPLRNILRKSKRHERRHLGK